MIIRDLTVHFTLYLYDNKHFEGCHFYLNIPNHRTTLHHLERYFTDGSCVYVDLLNLINTIDDRTLSITLC